VWSDQQADLQNTILWYSYNIAVKVMEDENYSSDDIKTYFVKSNPGTG